MKKILTVAALFSVFVFAQTSFAGLFSNTSEALKNTNSAIKADVNAQTKAAKDKQTKYQAEQKAKSDARKKKAAQEKAKRDAAANTVKKDFNTTKNDIKNIFSK